MISDVTIGQYLPGNSFIHKIDARIKIVISLLFMISVFLCRNYISLSFVLLLAFGVCALSRIKPKIILKGLKPIIIIVLFTTVINLFYGNGEPIFQFWILKITVDGINKAVFMGLRIIILVIFGLMLTYTTTPTSLTDAIEALLKPLTYLHIDVQSFAMTMTIALRFIPTLLEDVDKIMAAQKSRGADMESGNIFKRIKAIVPIMIPLFVSSFRRANELEYAMECRCYTGGNGRTKMKVMKMQGRDYFALIFALLYIASIILLRIFTTSII